MVSRDRRIKYFADGWAFFFPAVAIILLFIYSYLQKICITVCMLRTTVLGSCTVVIPEPGLNSPRFHYYVYASSCNSLFYAHVSFLYMYSYFLVSPILYTDNRMQNKYKENFKKRERGQKRENFMNCQKLENPSDSYSRGSS